MRTRRGLSTVVGAVFFVIAATTVISYISYSMNSIDEFSQSVIVAETENINRGLEGIVITRATIVGGEFNVTVSNTGSLPVHLTRLWVVDDNTVTPDARADLDVRINPGYQQYNIGQSTGISADSSISYNLKVVTERGNIATYIVSPDISTQIQLAVPATVIPEDDFRVTTFILNNSTIPNNIVNLIPTLTSNVTLTTINGPLPPSIQTLPQGNTAIFNWAFQAPQTSQGILLNASYVGAPNGSFVISNMTISQVGEAEEASVSQWSQAASRVGILISGIPNPINSAAATQYGYWGIGIINPLERNVEIYSVGIHTQTVGLVEGIEGTGTEPTTGWRLQDTGNGDMILWEGGDTPVTIPAKSVGQFRVKIDYKVNALTETLMIIQGLSSEGKLTAYYTTSTHQEHPMINTFYTSDPSDPVTNWTYLVEGIKSEKNDQIFNATVYNSASFPLASTVKIIILVPSDFTDVKSFGSNPGWGTASIIANPDNSHVIQVETTVSPMLGGTSKVYQFSADAPAVSDDKLYVLQTTTVYPNFNSGNNLQLASSLSEAGIEVIP